MLQQMGHVINKLNQRVGVTKSALPSTIIMFASRACFCKYAYAPLSSINCHMGPVVVDPHVIGVTIYTLKDGISW